MDRSVDVAIVGAGILGLAHAYHATRQGNSVALFERNPQAMGASVRNFGMLWPIGQSAGQMHALALRSRTHWLDILREAGLWHAECGSLHLAYQDDERVVLKEFATKAPDLGYTCSLLEPAAVRERAPSVRQEGMQAGLFSPIEVCVDPREVIAALPGWLRERFGVSLHFNTAVRRIEPPYLEAGAETWRADRIYVCSGDDFQTLYPEVFAGSGLTRCKLQMMRTTAYGDSWRVGPMLAAGLTLKHYAAFEICDSLPALKARLEAEMPEYHRYGIHVLVSQNGKGEVTLGDTHEYGLSVEPFDLSHLDDLVLEYLETFLTIPAMQIAQRWHGVYAKHPEQPLFLARPAEGVTIVTGIGGAGMTLSFGVAEAVLQGEL